MEPEAARNAKESLEMAFQMSNILETGLDRRTLSLLIVLCDRGLNSESLAALIREFSPPPTTTATPSPLSSSSNHDGDGSSKSTLLSPPSQP